MEVVESYKQFIDFYKYCTMCLDILNISCINTFFVTFWKVSNRILNQCYTMRNHLFILYQKFVFFYQFVKNFGWINYLKQKYLWFYSSSNRMTYNLIERTFKEIYYRSRNTRKKEFSCENDWHDDSNHGSLPTIFSLY